MFVAKTLSFLAAAALAGQSVALNTHRHGHQHLHQKKDLSVETEVVTVTDWVTVTKGIGAPAPSTSAAAAASSQNAPSPSPSQASTTQAGSAPNVNVAAADAPAATTLVTSVAAPSSKANPAPSANVLDQAAAGSPSEDAAQTTNDKSGYGVQKRGLAYNDANILSPFFGDGNKIGWAYNWGQVNDVKRDVEFVPMLWGPTSNFAPTWNANAKKAIAAGSKYLLSFNEPDNAGQSNLSPAAAKEAHIQYMNPFRGQAHIGTPAISNSNNEGQGISWLKGFVSACAGQCAIDFVAIHWYNPANTDEFFNHLRAVHKVVPDKPIWITEFAPSGSDKEINDFVATVVHKLDTDSEFSFVDRYAYFMAVQGSLLSSSNALSVYGKTFAFQ